MRLMRSKTFQALANGEVTVSGTTASEFEVAPSAADSVAIEVWDFAYEGAYLNSKQARQIGEYLIAWADRLERDQ